MDPLPQQRRGARASHHIKQVAVHFRRDDPKRSPVLVCQHIIGGLMSGIKGSTGIQHNRGTSHTSGEPDEVGHQLGAQPRRQVQPPVSFRATVSAVDIRLRLHEPYKSAVDQQGSNLSLELIHLAAPRLLPIIGIDTIGISLPGILINETRNFQALANHVPCLPKSFRKGWKQNPTQRGEQECPH